MKKVYLIVLVILTLVISGSTLSCVFFVSADTVQQKNDITVYIDENETNIEKRINKKDTNNYFFECDMMLDEIKEAELYVVDDENPKYVSKDGIVYSKDEKILYFCPPKYKGEVYIDDSVEIINKKAFCGCSDITDFVVDEKNPYYMSANGVLYTSGKAELLNYPPLKQDETLVIGPETRVIGDCLNCSGNAHSNNFLKTIVVENREQMLHVRGLDYYLNLDKIVLKEYANYLFCLCEADFYSYKNEVEYVREDSLEPLWRSKYASKKGISMISETTAYINEQGIDLFESYARQYDDIRNSTTFTGVFKFTVPETPVKKGDKVEKIDYIDVSPDNRMFSSKDGILYSKDKKTLYYCPPMYRGKVYINENVEKINLRAFCEAKKVEEFFVDENNRYFSSKSGMLFNKDGSYLLSFPQNKKVDTLVVGSEVEEINSFAFGQNSKLKKVKFLDRKNHVFVPGYTFAWCKNMNKVIRVGASRDYVNTCGEFVWPYLNKYKDVSSKKDVQMDADAIFNKNRTTDERTALELVLFGCAGVILMVFLILIVIKLTKCMT